jgi:2'-5' RNA ligase
MQREGIGKYFLALVPPPPVFNDVHAMKNYFSEHYNSKAALRSPPHITLHMPFEWKLKKEKELTEGFDRFAATQACVALSLDGFGAFPPRVIFIKVVATEALLLLQKELTRFCKVEFNLFNAQYKDNPFHPHLTVAFRDLRKDLFANAWQEFSVRNYSTSFAATDLVLLRHDGTKWLPHHRAAFSKLLVT